MDKLHDGLQSINGVDRGTDSFEWVKEEIGEWALSELVKFKDISLNVWAKRIHEYNLLEEIAVACLGENSVKRMSEAKEIYNNWRSGFE